MRKNKTATTLVALSAASSLALSLATVNVATAAPVERIAGKDRFATSLEVAKKNFPNPNTVVIASGLNFPDALSAGVLAATYSAPLLLTGERLTPEQTQYLTKTKPAVLTVGGSAVIPATLKGELRNLGLTVREAQGRDRYATAVAVARDVLAKAPSDTLFIASGRDYPDALAGGALAAHMDAPLVLADRSVPGDVAKLIADMQPKQIYILGGSGAVTTQTQRALEGMTKASFKRLGGKNRFETAALVAKEFGNIDQVSLVSGLNYPDALSAAPVAAIKKQPIWLALKDCSPVTPPVKAIFYGGVGVLNNTADTVCKTQPVETPADSNTEKLYNIDKEVRTEAEIDSISVLSPDVKAWLKAKLREASKLGQAAISLGKYTSKETLLAGMSVRQGNVGEGWVEFLFRSTKTGKLTSVGGQEPPKCADLERLGGPQKLPPGFNLTCLIEDGQKVLGYKDLSTQKVTRY